LQEWCHASNTMASTQQEPPLHPQCVCMAALPSCACLAGSMSGRYPSTAVQPALHHRPWPMEPSGTACFLGRPPAGGSVLLTPHECCSLLGVPAAVSHTSIWCLSSCCRAACFASAAWVLSTRVLGAPCPHLARLACIAAWLRWAAVSGPGWSPHSHSCSTWVAWVALPQPAGYPFAVGVSSAAVTAGSSGGPGIAVVHAGCIALRVDNLICGRRDTTHASMGAGMNTVRTILVGYHMLSALLHGSCFLCTPPANTYRSPRLEHPTVSLPLQLRHEPLLGEVWLFMHICSRQQGLGTSQVPVQASLLHCHGCTRDLWACVCRWLHLQPN
jgi:hypothetical protein